MIHRTLILVAATLFVAATAFAQTETKGKRTEVDSATGQRKTVEISEVKSETDVTPRNNMIVINPLKFIFYYNISYYRRIDKNFVVGGGIQLPTLSGFSGFGVNAELRFHPSGKSMRGFYLCPNFSYNSLKYEFESTNAKAGNFTAGLLIAWQWFPSDEFAMGLGIGIDHNFLSGTDNTTAFSSYSGNTPALRFDIGYAWE